MYINITYRFEVRANGLRAQFTDNENTAIRLAFDAAEATKKTVTIVDNDNGLTYARVGNNCIQVLR